MKRKNTFRDIVTDYSLGLVKKSKLTFYAKRLAKETATRRLAAILVVGLLLFQFTVFLAPPKPSYAGSSYDLVAGGPFTKNSLITTVWNNNPENVQQVFNRLQITQAKMQSASTGTVCKGQDWLSMGRFADSGSTEFQPGIYIGPAESRWQQNCFEAIIGTDKVQDTLTGEWYEWGVVLDCGNIILKRTTPPAPAKSIVCESLNTTNAGPIALGTEVGYRGVATGDNVSPNELVNMAYGVYKPDGTPLGQLQGDLKRANGIADNAQGKFEDPERRNFVFSEPGTFVVRLWVSYNADGNSVIAPNSATGSCTKTIVVQAPKTLVCKDLKMQSTSGIAPFTPVLTGKAEVSEGVGNDPKPSKYEYTLYREVSAETSQTVKLNGKIYEPAQGVARIIHNNTTLRDPEGEPPTSFSASSFAQNAAGNYLVILRVYDQAGTQVSDPQKDCWQPFTVTAQQQSFSCLKLTANPASATTVPFVTTLTAQATALNTSISQYQFDFGDGNKQTVNSDQLSQSLQHTYTKGGKYTATVKVVAKDNLSSTQDSCSTEIIIEQQIFKKTVTNTTLLTTDGKPTDANNQTARAGDKLTYTIGISNLGATAVQGFVFEDTISDILQYADLVDNGGATLQQKNGQTVLVWPATDIPPTTNSDNPIYVTKSFTVQVKNPIPTIAHKPTDGTNYDCKLQDEFFGNLVATPLFINPAKQLECQLATLPTLPQTGSAFMPLAVIGLLAASSVYLFMRNRLLKRELELVETLSDGGIS